jgi:NAD(P)-dependent dehydrogenase (short-subunit alcohol dehydrogenase family)
MASSALPDYSNLLSVKDNVVLVTGASSGLGAAFSRFLASQGAKVVLAARRQEKLEALVTEIKAAGGEATAVPLDVGAGKEKIDDSIDAAIGAYGHIDVLVNNAGVYDGGAFPEDTQEAFDRTFSVNVGGLYFTAQAVARHMISAGIKGRIINISSNMAREGLVMKGSEIYSASKAAVVQMTRVMAVDLAPKGINVNSIAPGVHTTEMTGAIVDNATQSVKAVPDGRWGDTAVDLMGTLLLLASERGARHMVGAIIPIDGGHHLYTFDLFNPTAVFTQ